MENRTLMTHFPVPQARHQGDCMKIFIGGVLCCHTGAGKLASTPSEIAAVSQNCPKVWQHS